MSAIVKIWVEASYNPAFRCGGWAFVRRDAETRAGPAGGERSVTAARAALAALAAALKDAPVGASVEILSSDKTVHSAWRRLAALRAGGEPPAEDLDLWARLQTATQGRGAKVVPTANAPGGPTAFAKAWADQAYERTKAKGAFVAPIPKVNLAKAGA
jgi:ribonuclease HI